MSNYESSTPKTYTFTEYILTKSISENPIPVKRSYEATPEMRKNISNIADSFRMNEYRHNRCSCSGNDRHFCNLNCSDCKYKMFNELSLSSLVNENNDSNAQDKLAALNCCKDDTRDIDRKIDLEHFFETLDEESKKIMQFVFDFVSDRDAAKEMKMSKSTYNRKKQKIIFSHKDEIYSILSN